MLMLVVFVLIILMVVIALAAYSQFSVIESDRRTREQLTAHVKNLISRATRLDRDLSRFERQFVALQQRVEINQKMVGELKGVMLELRTDITRINAKMIYSGRWPEDPR